MAVVYDFCEPKSIDYFTREQKGNLKPVLQFTLIQNVFPLDKYFKSILDRKNPANSKISSEEKKPWFQFDFVSFDFFF